MQLQRAAGCGHVNLTTLLIFTVSFPIYQDTDRVNTSHGLHCLPPSTKLKRSFTDTHYKAHIVGLSLGSYIGLELMRQAGDCIDHAVLSGLNVLPLPNLSMMTVSGVVLLLEDVASITCPTLLVAGEHEHSLIRQSLVKTRQALLNAQARIVPEVGHGWSGERPELFVRTVRAWVTDSPLPPELQRVP